MMLKILRVMAAGLISAGSLAAQSHVVQSPQASLDTRDYTITTSVQGQGTISRNPNKLAYAWRESVILAATPGSTGFSFSHWSGNASGSVNPLTLVMQGNISRSVTAHFTSAHTAPSGLRATHGTYANRIDIDWIAVTGADRYEVWRSLSADFEQAIVIFEPELNYYEDRSANPGLTYHYWVKAIFGREKSAAAGPVEGMRRDESRPPLPTGLSATQGTFSDRVRLTWDPVGLAQAYEVYRSSQESQSTAQALELDVEAVQYDDHAPVGWTFYYWVAARSALDISSSWEGPVRGRAGSSVTWWGSENLELQMPDDYADAIQIELGRLHGVALSPEGTVGVWGSNFHGQQNLPAGLNGIVAVAAGYYHSLALHGDGTVVGWGRDDFAQSTGGALLGNLAAVAGGAAFSLGLGVDGRVYAWGDNRQGQTSVPVGTERVVMITAGGEHALALLADGTVRAWGSNSHGQATVPAGLTNVQAVAAGQRHSLALLQDGTVRGWGDNSRGQAPAYWDGAGPVKHGGISPAAAPSNVVSIAAGLLHSVMVTHDGRVTTLGLATGTPPAENEHIALAVAGEDFSSALRRQGLPAKAWVSPSVLTAPQGARVILRASVLATGRPTYRWRRDGVEIPGAAGPFLELSAVSAAEAGNYTVEVSNETGTLESAPSRLDVGGFEAVVGYFAGYQALAKDWGATEWFGRYHHLHFPWIYHTYHGWLWCHGWGGGELQFYRPPQPPQSFGSWLYSTPEAYPVLFDFQSGGWLLQQ